MIHGPIERGPVNIHEAKTSFSRLVDRAQAGETIVIARAGKPAAMLVPFERGRDGRGGGEPGGRGNAEAGSGDTGPAMTASIERDLAKVARSGVPREIRFRGRTYLVVPKGRRRLDIGTLPRRKATACTPEELVATTWENEWRTEP